MSYHYQKPKQIYRSAFSGSHLVKEKFEICQRKVVALTKTRKLQLWQIFLNLIFRYDKYDPMDDQTYCSAQSASSLHVTTTTHFTSPVHHSPFLGIQYSDILPPAGSKWFRKVTTAVEEFAQQTHGHKSPIMLFIVYITNFIFISSFTFIHI